MYYFSTPRGRAELAGWHEAVFCLIERFQQWRKHHHYLHYLALSVIDIAEMAGLIRYGVPPALLRKVFPSER